MIRKISKKFVEYISENNYSEQEKDEMEYILNTMIFEAIKLGLTFIIFTVLGYSCQSMAHIEDGEVNGSLLTLLPLHYTGC